MSRSESETDVGTSADVPVTVRQVTPTLSASAYVAPPWMTSPVGSETRSAENAIRPSAWPSPASVSSIPSNLANGTRLNNDTRSIPRPASPDP